MGGQNKDVGKRLKEFWFKLFGARYAKFAMQIRNLSNPHSVSLTSQHICDFLFVCVHIRLQKSFDAKMEQKGVP